jgi:hypothetical protein
VVGGRWSAIGGREGDGGAMAGRRADGMAEGRRPR